MSEVLSNNAQEVLAHFGLESRDFPRLDRIVDFDALARHIRKPTKIAVCEVLDRDGKIVKNEKGPVRVHVEVPVRNALKILAEKSYRWLKWWD